jgi:hypothetical protein
MKPISKLIIAAAAALLMSTTAQAGDLQIQFQHGFTDGHTIRETVSVRNNSDTDYATVAWDCASYDKDGYKTGGGSAVLHYVRRKSVVTDTMYISANGSAYTAKCELVGTEKGITKENARLYPPPTLSSNGVWDDARKPQGDADAD